MNRKPVYRTIRPGFLVREDQQVEAVRYYTNDTDGWYGWVVRDLDGGFSDPLPNRVEAVKAMLTWVASTCTDRTWDDPHLVGYWNEAQKHYVGR